MAFGGASAARVLALRALTDRRLRGSRRAMQRELRGMRVPAARQRPRHGPIRSHLRQLLLPGDEVLHLLRRPPCGLLPRHPCCSRWALAAWEAACGERRSRGGSLLERGQRRGRRHGTLSYGAGTTRHIVGPQVRRAQTRTAVHKRVPAPGVDHWVDRCCSTCIPQAPPAQPVPGQTSAQLPAHTRGLAAAVRRRAARQSCAAGERASWAGRSTQPGARPARRMKHAGGGPACCSPTHHPRLRATRRLRPHEPRHHSAVLPGRRRHAGVTHRRTVEPMPRNGARLRATAGVPLTQPGTAARLSGAVITPQVVAAPVPPPPVRAPT